jgi:hypothetical protein
MFGPQANELAHLSERRPLPLLPGLATERSAGTFVSQVQDARRHAGVVFERSIHGD